MKPLLPHRPAPDDATQNQDAGRPDRPTRPWWPWGLVVVGVAVAGALLLPHVPLHMWRDTGLAGEPTTVYPTGTHASAATNALLLAALGVAAAAAHARVWWLAAVAAVPALVALGQAGTITAAGQAAAQGQHLPALGIVAHVWPNAGRVAMVCGTLVAAGAVTVAFQQRQRWSDLRPDNHPTVRDRIVDIARRVEVVKAR